VQEEIAEPLGLDGMYVGAPEGVLHRAADLLWPDPVVGRTLPRWITRPLTDTLSTLAKIGPAIHLPGFQIDVGSLLDALAPRGIGSFDFGANDTLRVAIPAANGLFTARSLARMYAALAEGGEIDGVRLLSRSTLERATEPQGEGRRRVVVPFDMRWRLGYHGVATTRGIPRRAFGHFGFGGSGAFAAPSRELAVGMIVNSGMGTPFGDARIARIGGAALEGVERGSEGGSSWRRTARGVISFLSPSTAAALAPSDRD
jgi:CubicO group peptidase (beta-lactamase class C family)